MDSARPWGASSDTRSVSGDCSKIMAEEQIIRIGFVMELEG